MAFHHEVSAHRVKTNETVKYKLEKGRKEGKPTCRIVERWEGTGEGFESTKLDVEPIIAETRVSLWGEIQKEIRALETKAGYEDIELSPDTNWGEAPWLEEMLKP